MRRRRNTEETTLEEFYPEYRMANTCKQWRKKGKKHLYEFERKNPTLERARRRGLRPEHLKSPLNILRCELPGIKKTTDDGKGKGVFWHGDYVISKGTELMAYCSEGDITTDKNLRHHSNKLLTCSGGQ